MFKIIVRRTKFGATQQLLFYLNRSKFRSISSLGSKSENLSMLCINSRKLIILIVYSLLCSNIIADQQILILVEPHSLKSEQDKLKTSDWKFITVNQEKSLNKVLNAVLIVDRSF